MLPLSLPRSPVHVGPGLRFPLDVGAGVLALGVFLVEVARAARVDVDDAVVLVGRRLVDVNV